ncbi:MAG: MiaB/RimO family radical SAM methylthiotransferase, partial [Oscillospiraceae bacterium]|nr:MiaB/RimO family radical SAM methylthiotransferase [Oscillospiraceae bacterium]
MHIHYHTFGCKVNQYETENIRQAMEADGHTSVNNLEEADVCIINTCTVTHEADRKLIQLVNRIKRVNPKAIIVMCGCYSQINENANQLADIVVGTSNKSRIPQLVAEYNSQKTAEVLPHYKGEHFETMANIGSARKTRAVIKIQDGCDRFCTYCIIPYARGRARSKPINEIEAEAKALVKAGHKELDLVGINLSCYGHDLGLNLADAVERVCKTSGAERVRLGSLEAELISEEIIKRLSELDNFCPHFHLSLHSGCDKTLREMGRKYDKAEYFTIVNNIRKYFPDCAITTDIMVGFPGETDDDFSESLE